MRNTKRTTVYLSKDELPKMQIIEEKTGLTTSQIFRLITKIWPTDYFVEMCNNYKERL